VGGAVVTQRLGVRNSWVVTGPLSDPLPNVAKNPAKTKRGHFWSAAGQPEDGRSPLTGRMRLKEAESSSQCPQEMGCKKRQDDVGKRNCGQNLGRQERFTTGSGIPGGPCQRAFEYAQSMPTPRCETQDFLRLLYRLGE
jgi:hypothetical protein